jgi:hypothetical protein
MTRTKLRFGVCSLGWLAVACAAQLRGGGGVAAGAGDVAAEAGDAPSGAPPPASNASAPGCFEGRHAMTPDGSVSLKEKEQRTRQEEMLQSAVKDTNEACGTQIKAIGDWPSFKGALTLHSMHVGANCAVALDAIAGLCHAGDEGKQAVRASVKTFICHAAVAADAESEVRVDRAGKTVAFGTRVHDGDTSPKYMVQTCLRERL